MKTFIKYIFTGFILLIAFSCNNDFLKEKSDFSADVSVWSDICVFPEWETNECHIYSGYGIANAKFSVVNAPQWLNISESGQFKDGVATVICSANAHDEFSEIGIYNAIMTIDVEGIGKVAVPVAYVIEGNPIIECASSLTLSNYNGASVPLAIKNNGNGILIWNIVEYPDWIQINSGLPVIENHVVASYSERTIEVLVDVWKLMDADTMDGRIVLVSNDKNNPVTVINLTFGGNPSIHFYTNEIDFGRSSVTQNLNFANYGDGYLEWKIEKCPEWITVSKSKGVLFPSHGTDITLTCDRNRLPAGENSAVITLKTNDRNNPAYAITVKCRTGNNPENVKPIEGKITDAWLDKITDILYLTTSQPNRFIAYDTKNKTIARTITLSKMPNCFSVSEDGHQAAIGHAGEISSIDMNNFSVIKSIEINHGVYDIEWVANDEFYYTPVGGSFADLHWVNIRTGEAPETYGSDLDGATIIKKIPNQPYLIASRMNTSPSGITVYDINKGKVNYMHQTIDQFWFSADGTYLFDYDGNIYKTSLLPTYSGWPGMPAIGRFDSNAGIRWIDQSIATGILWAISGRYYGSDTTNEIIQISSTDFSIVDRLSYDDYYKATNGAEYQVQAQYVFANSSGTELIVIKRDYNANQGTSSNIWLLEHIPVTN